MKGNIKITETVRIEPYGDQWAVMGDGGMLSTGTHNDCVASLSPAQRRAYDAHLREQREELRRSGEREAIICRTGRDPGEVTHWPESGLDANT